MKEELKFAALYGPGIIPYYRRKIKNRPREMKHSDIADFLGRVKQEESSSTLIWTNVIHWIKEYKKSTCIDCLIASPNFISRCLPSHKHFGMKKDKEVYKLNYGLSFRNSSESYSLDFYFDTLMPDDLILITQRSLSKGVALKIREE